jgi:hypothetical protein
MEIDRCCGGRQKLGVGEDARSPPTPTECTCSSGKLGDELGREHKGHAISWVNEDMRA